MDGPHETFGLLAALEKDGDKDVNHKFHGGKIIVVHDDPIALRVLVLKSGTGGRLILRHIEYIKR